VKPPPMPKTAKHRRAGLLHDIVGITDLANSRRALPGSDRLSCHDGVSMGAMGLVDPTKGGDVRIRISPHKSLAAPIRHMAEESRLTECASDSDRQPKSCTRQANRGTRSVATR